MTTADTSSARNRLQRRQEGGAEVKQGKTVRQLVEEMTPQFARALPSTITPERFTRLVLTELRRTPKLLACERESLLGALMMAAELGLEPGGPLGHCYLIPFKDKRNGTSKATFVLGYKGIVDLAHRSGRMLSVTVREVREHDHFVRRYGLEEKLEHEPADGDRGEITAWYGIVRYATGGHYWEVWSRAEMEEHRDRFATTRDRNGNVTGAWVTDFPAMAAKTVLRSMAKFMPLSPELGRALSVDEQPLTFGADDELVIDVDADDDEAAPELPDEPPSTDETPAPEPAPEAEA